MTIPKVCSNQHSSKNILVTLLTTWDELSGESMRLHLWNKRVKPALS